MHHKRQIGDISTFYFWNMRNKVVNFISWHIIWYPWPQFYLLYLVITGSIIVDTVTVEHGGSIIISIQHFKCHWNEICFNVNVINNTFNNTVSAYELFDKEQHYPPPPHRLVCIIKLWQEHIMQNWAGTNRNRSTYDFIPANSCGTCFCLVIVKFPRYSLPILELCIMCEKSNTLFSLA